MRALLKAGASEGPWLEDVPEPEVVTSDVLVRARGAGIGGADPHGARRDAPAQETAVVPPLVGHEGRRRGRRSGPHASVGRVDILSGTLGTAICLASLRALELIERSHEPHDRLAESAAHVRRAMTTPGLDLLPGEHPIAPWMAGGGLGAARLADAPVELDVCAAGISFAPIPRPTARIPAARTRGGLDLAVARFVRPFGELAA